MPAVPAPAKVLEGAVLFTDIVGFTEYTALEGDGRALEMLALQERLVSELLPQGARVVKELGDGMLLWFPEPCAAIEHSLALQERFGEAAIERSMPLWVRMGLHWGRQAARRADIVGHDVNVASRIMDVAGPGELLLSEAMLERTEGGVNGVEFEELGPVVMKGIPEPVRLYRATRATLADPAAGKLQAARARAASLR